LSFDSTLVVSSTFTFFVGLASSESSSFDRFSALLSSENQIFSSKLLLKITQEKKVCIFAEMENLYKSHKS